MYMYKNMYMYMGVPGCSDSKESACNVGDPVISLGWEDPLEEGMAAHSSILAWKILMNRGAWQETVHGVTKSQTQLSNQAQPPSQTHEETAY